MIRTANLHIGARVASGGYPVSLTVEGQTVNTTLADDLGWERLQDWGVDDRDGVIPAVRERVLDGADRAGHAARVGAHLHGLVATGEVAYTLRQLAAEDFHVLLSAEDELQALPWELIQDQGDFPFSNVARPWSRFAGALAAGAPPAHCPLKVLIVVGSAEDDVALEAEEEVRGIVRALAASTLTIEWHVARRPSRQQVRDLHRWLAPDVLHLVGHSKHSRHGSALLVSHERGRWEYTTSHVNEDLALARPRLVVLNACRLSDQGASRQSADGAWSIARAFSDGGAAAVVAMQGDVQGVDASRFAETFYDALLVQRMAVDSAVAEARTRIEAGGVQTRDFGFPTLTLRVEPDAVLAPPESRLKPSQLSALRKRLHVVPLVDRCEERYALRDALDALGGSSHLINVVGDGKLGKTWLVRWCLYVKALLGENVAYADLYRDDGVLLDPGAVLRQIVDALSACPMHGEGNAAAFEGAALAIDETHSDDPVPEIMRDFRARLAQAASGSDGLLLALDHLSGASTRFLETIGEQIIVPIADGEVPKVRLLVARRSNGEDAARFPYDESIGRTIHIKHLPAEEHMSLSMAVLYHFGLGRHQAPVAPEEGPWTPERLGPLSAYAAMVAGR